VKRQVRQPFDLFWIAANVVYDGDKNPVQGRISYSHVLSGDSLGMLKFNGFDFCSTDAS
jgi:hypothetical protein